MVRLPRTWNILHHAVDASMNSIHSVSLSIIAIFILSLVLVQAEDANVRNALLELYNDMDGPNWVCNQNWTEPSISYCSWPGVCCGSITELRYLDPEELLLKSDCLLTCAPSGNVVGLLLHYQDLGGTFPSSQATWEAFEHLQFMKMHTNVRLGGTIPPALSVLADSLIELDLSITNVEGTIPTEIGNLRQLQTLSLTCASISGAGSSGRLSGSIPSELGLMESLTAVELTNCELNSTIPSEFGQLRSLVSLRLDGNKLSGSVPSDIFSIPTLEYVHLDSNMLSGPIPILSGVPQLSSLSLSNNQISGALPDLRGLTNLQVVDLSYNTFLVDTFINITSKILSSGASVVDLSGLRFTGTVPSLSQWYNLLGYEAATALATAISESTVELSLRDCQLVSPKVPSDWLLFLFKSRLRRLDISNNPGLSGYFPKTFIEGTSVIQYVDIRNTSIAFQNASVLAGNPDEVEVYPEQHLSCHPVYIPERPQVVLRIDPLRYGYLYCTCVRGYHGPPGRCELNTDAIVYIGPIIAVAVAIALLVGTVLWRKNRRRLNRKRTSEALKDYAAAGLGDQELKPMPLPIPEFLKIPYGKIEILKDIGFGGQARVSLGLWQHIKVAVKQYYDVDDIVSSSEFIKECTIHQQLRHPNIIRLLGVCDSPPCTVTEFADRGSVFDVLIRNAPELRQGFRRYWIALHVAKGMEYLHSRNLLHRDLKSPNVFLDRDYRAMVGDFGSARQEISTICSRTMGIGSHPWMAPETFESTTYTNKADVYSYAVFLYELLVGEPPYSELRFQHEIHDFVCSGGRPKLPPTCSPFFLDLITRCWSHNPQERLSFEEITDMLESIEPQDMEVPDDV